jgi:hypothetical protein
MDLKKMHSHYTNHSKIIAWTTFLTITFLANCYFTSSCNAESKFTTIEEKMYEENGIFYKTNRFGDIFPLWEAIPENELTEKLLTFINALKEKESPIIIEIPHEKSPLLKAVIDSHFTLHYADQSQSAWIIHGL